MPNRCGCGAHINFIKGGGAPIKQRLCVECESQTLTTHTHTHTKTNRQTASTHTHTGTRHTHTHEARARTHTPELTNTHSNTQARSCTCKRQLAKRERDDRTRFVPGCSHRTLPYLRQSSGIGCRCRGCTRRRTKTCTWKRLAATGHPEISCKRCQSSTLSGQKPHRRHVEERRFNRAMQHKGERRRLRLRRRAGKRSQRHCTCKLRLADQHQRGWLRQRPVGL